MSRHSSDSASEINEARIDRRDFLHGAATTTVAGGLVSVLADRAIAHPVTTESRSNEDIFAVDANQSPETTFPQSVASGGPTPSGGLLWTRIAPDAYASDTPLAVEIATDTTFEPDAIVHRGVIDGAHIDPAHDFTVKVDVDGLLATDCHYNYRFIYDGVASRIGRGRTLPESDASPDRLAFAVLTCQDYQNGYYPAYHHVAEEDVDFLVHLGDFIYESANGQYQAPFDSPPSDRELSLPSRNGLATSLDDFRYLYETYRSDRFLQEALERHTLIAGWDDHEVANGRYWNYETDTPVLPPHKNGNDPEYATQVTANGIQAWVEYMPERVEYDPSAKSLHDQFQLWRRFAFGDLVDLVVTDERLYRDPPPCGDRTITCRTEETPGRTMLGNKQKAWFKNFVTDSNARWTAWANEVLTMPLTADDGDNQVEFLHDSWDGYQAERAELMNAIEDAALRNFVSLTGDLHASMVGYQQAGYGEVSWDFDKVGVEFMTPSITSVNAADVIDFPSDWDRQALAETAKEQNDHLEYVNWYNHGYSVIEFGSDDCIWTTYGVEKDINSSAASKRKLAEYRVPDGEISLDPQYRH
jgi:alkaline phosphatase D